jgi:exodeoxyribonuclease V alpha subunit
MAFRASFLKATAPTTTEGIEKYLGSGMIRGIGPIYAKKLVRAFSDAVFDVIEPRGGADIRSICGVAFAIGTNSSSMAGRALFDERREQKS